MMKKSIKAILIGFTIIFVLMAVVGCAGVNENPEGDQGATPGESPEMDQGMNPGENQGQDQNQDQTQDQGMTGTQQRFGLGGMQENNQNTDATQIEQQIKQINGVNQADCVVSGDTAVVGCDSNMQLGNLRSMVEQKVKQANPKIKKVVVTDMENIISEIKQMKQNGAVGNNGQGAGMGNLDAQIKRIIARITPDTQ